MLKSTKRAITIHPTFLIPSNKAIWPYSWVFRVILQITIYIFFFPLASTPVGRQIEEINSVTDADSRGQAEIDSLLDQRNAAKGRLQKTLLIRSKSVQLNICNGTNENVVITRHPRYLWGSTGIAGILFTVRAILDQKDL